MRAFDVNVVLVRSLYESNIGASSRAMANMGASQLILIDPKCELTIKAQKAAATGQKALQNRKIYSSFADFYKSEPEGIRLSFTARDGRGRQVQDFSETLRWIANEHPMMQENEQGLVPIYLIFGPEDWGLSAEDLELTHFACSIPTFGDNTSLNLAQAVLLALYTLRLEWGGEKAQLMGQQATKEIQQEEVFPEKSLHLWLSEMGFDLSTHSKMNAYTVLKRMLLQHIPTKKELGILEIVLQQSIRKLREYNELRKKYGESDSSEDSV
jgi:tRNA/rRNA methyltransferase